MNPAASLSSVKRLPEYSPWQKTGGGDQSLHKLKATAAQRSQSLLVFRGKSLAFTWPEADREDLAERRSGRFVSNWN